MSGGGSSAVGLCAGCRHCRVVENRRGSRFFMCERARHDPRYRKYPPLPVLRCPGFTPAEKGDRDPSTEGPAEAGR